MHDNEIINRLKADDATALEYAIETYSGYTAAVISKVLGTTGTNEDKEELLTDTFVALWNHRQKLREKGNLKYWLAVVARNSSFQFLRKLNFTAPLEENLLFEHEADVLDKVEQMEQVKMVRLVVGNLPEEDKDIFLRHYFWQQSVSRISSETGMNISTIKSRLSRGREKLKALLIKEGCIQ